MSKDVQRSYLYVSHTLLLPTVVEMRSYQKNMGAEECVGVDVNPTCESNAMSIVVFFFGTCCWMHQYHLIVKKSLITGDLICDELRPWMNIPRKYYSTVAKILHVWRDYAKSWHAAWKKLFLAVDARKYAATRPPLALSGRLGAVNDGRFTFWHLLLASSGA